MALIKCNGCGHMISDRAIKCPKCGTPNQKVAGETKPKDNEEKVIVESKSPKVESIASNDCIGKPKRHLWKIVCGIIAVGGIAVGGIYFYMDSQEKARMQYEAKLKAQADSARVAEIAAQAAEQARLDSIKCESIKVAMPVVENFIRSYYSDEFQGIRNKHIEWIPTDYAIKALTDKGYQIKKKETTQVEGEGGEYEKIIITTLNFTIKEDDDDILYYEIIIEDGFCGGINIVFHDEDLKNDFIKEALSYGYVRNSHKYINGYDEKNLLVWTLKGDDGQRWIYDEFGDLTISINEKSVRLNYSCI